MGRGLWYTNYDTYQGMNTEVNVISKVFLNYCHGRKSFIVIQCQMAYILDIYESTNFGGNNVFYTKEPVI